MCSRLRGSLSVNITMQGVLTLNASMMHPTIPPNLLLPNPHISNDSNPIYPLAQNKTLNTNI